MTGDAAADDVEGVVHAEDVASQARFRGAGNDLGSKFGEERGEHDAVAVGVGGVTGGESLVKGLENLVVSTVVGETSRGVCPRSHLGDTEICRQSVELRGVAEAAVRKEGAGVVKGGLGLASRGHLVLDGVVQCGGLGQ